MCVCEQEDMCCVNRAQVGFHAFRGLDSDDQDLLVGRWTLNPGTQKTNVVGGTVCAEFRVQVGVLAAPGLL